MIDTTKVTIPDPLDVYRERNEQLEQLCLDMYSWEIVLTGEYKTAFLECFKDRMDTLGLLGVDEYGAEAQGTYLTYDEYEASVAETINDRRKP